MASSKTQRLLDVISYLVGRRIPVRLEELMTAVPDYAEKWSADDGAKRATVRRMFERDKDELRDLGIPIETVSHSTSFDMESGDGYRLARKDFYLPYLRILGRRCGSTGAPESRAGATRVQGIGTFDLAEEDITAALEGLRHVATLPDFPLVREARSAYRKLAFDLDPDWFASAPVRFLPPAGPVASRRTMETLSEAVLRRKWLTFRYRGIRRDETTERRVDPYGLFFHAGRWYVVGHDHEREALRVFHPGRMENVEFNRKRAGSPDFEVPADFEVAALENRAPWELEQSQEEGDEPEILQIEVLFRHPRSLWVERNGLGETVDDRMVQHGNGRHDGSVVRSFSVQDEEVFYRWLLGLAGGAEVIAPSDSRRRFRARAKAVADAHAGSVDG